MATAKEVVFFTQSRTYCFPSGCTIDELNKKRKKLYGVLSGLSVVPYEFDLDADDDEMLAYIKRDMEADEVIISQEKLKDKIAVFAINKEVAKEIFETHGLSYLIISDILLLETYKDNLNDNKISIVGYLDPLNAMLSYMIIGKGTMYQAVQRKEAPNAGILDKDEVIQHFKREIEQIAKMESDRAGESVEYLIAGLNTSYDSLIRTVYQVSPKKGLQTALIDKRAVLYKKTAIVAAIAGFVFDMTLIPKYFHTKREISIMDKKIERLNSYIAKEKEIIKQLYKEKGKTIVLQDKIDIAKISKILKDINVLPPGKVVYKDTNNAILVDMYYVNNNILAQKYYYELKKNPKIQVSLFINPTFNISRIHVAIPKEVVR